MEIIKEVCVKVLGEGRAGEQGRKVDILQLEKQKPGEYKSGGRKIILYCRPTAQKELRFFIFVSFNVLNYLVKFYR